MRQPARIADDLLQIGNDQADLLVVVAYGQILPEALLRLPRLGAVNVHASLLPRWRGAAPIQRAILAGDRESGITLMQMEAGLDTGPMLLREPCEILPDDTAGTLEGRLAQIGATCLVAGLSRMSDGNLTGVVQPAEGMTYAHKIDKSEANMDWAASAVMVDRQIRAFNPVPGAFSHIGGVRLKILAGAVTETSATVEPGTLVEVGPQGLGVATADRVFRVAEVQPAGGRAMAVRDFLNAHQLDVGNRFERDFIPVS